MQGRAQRQRRAGVRTTALVILRASSKLAGELYGA